MDRITIYRTMYGKYASDAHNPRVVATLRFLEAYPSESFLDIGCGDGTVTGSIARAVKATTVKGIDISEEGCAGARQKGIECFAVDTDKDDLPFAPASFDLVNCGDIIEHVFDTDKLLESVARVLKPGGKFLITTPNIASWHARISLAFGYNPYKCSVALMSHRAGKIGHISDQGGAEHIRFFTLKALKDILCFHGFRILTVFGFPSQTNKSIPRWLALPLNAAESFTSLWPPLASEIGVFCTRDNNA